MSKQPNPAFANWLKSTPPASIGARAFLASRRRIHRGRFIPIQLFGFVLDEDGPKIMAPDSDGAGGCSHRGR